MENRAAELRARRAARIKARRRRRHAVTLAALIGVLGLAVMLAIVVSRRPVGRTAVRAAPPSAAVALGPAAARGRRSEAQLGAVERLAAYGLPLFCGGRSKRMVALTFDDGPSPYTRLAIAKLRKHHLRVTFFLVGKQIRAFPGLARLEKPVGVVGDHTMTHPFLPALPRAEMVQEIAGAKALIEHVTAQPVVLFRPPYEGRTPAIDREVRALGMLEVLWNVDSGDSLGANYAGIERNVLAGLHPGSIILMHENHGQTIRALLTIFAALARCDEGFEEACEVIKQYKQCFTAALDAAQGKSSIDLVDKPSEAASEVGDFLATSATEQISNAGDTLGTVGQILEVANTLVSLNEAYAMRFG
jgi:peptidoglycan/xylan/chitin deacetylase (PgdA/CDA1 family)